MTDVRRVLDVVQEANDQGLEVIPPAGVLTGLSGTRLTSLLQRLPKVTGHDYLEIGTYQGWSLLHTAIANPQVHCIGIDNFNFFNPDGQNKKLVTDRARALSVTNYSLVVSDFEVALPNLRGPIGTYFIDGPHDYRSQLVCLAFAPRFLADSGVIVVDDANYPHVRQATYDFLTFWPEYKLVFETYTRCHPSNMSEAELKEARAGYWNGAHVIVRDPADELDGLTPRVPGNPRFIRDHIVHSHRWGPLAAESADLAASLLHPWRLPKALVRLVRHRITRAAELQGRFPSVNTESENLPTRTASLRTRG